MFCGGKGGGGGGDERHVTSWQQRQSVGAGQQGRGGQLRDRWGEGEKRGERDQGGVGGFGTERQQGVKGGAAGSEGRRRKGEKGAAEPPADGGAGVQAERREWRGHLAVATPARWAPLPAAAAAARLQRKETDRLL